MNTSALRQPTAKIQRAIFERSSTLPLFLNDYAEILRLYLAEANGLPDDFMAICDVAFAQDIAERFLPEKRIAVPSDQRVFYIPLSIPGSDEVKQLPPYFFIARVLPQSAAITALSLIDNDNATFGAWGEILFFQTMEHHDIPPHKALRAVHEAMHTRAVRKSNGKVLGLTPRLQTLGDCIGELLAKHQIPWN